MITVTNVRMLVTIYSRLIKIEKISRFQIKVIDIFSFKLLMSIVLMLRLNDIYVLDIH